MSSLFEKHGEWIRFFAMIGFFCLLHFGDNRYVAKSEYAGDVARIGTAIGEMKTAVALLQERGRVQDDHETRIRALEQKIKLTLNHETTPSLHPVWPGLYPVWTPANSFVPLRARDPLWVSR